MANSRSADQIPEFIWGSELWDETERLSSYTLQGISLIEKYGQFLRDRAGHEAAFAQGLHVLRRKYLDLGSGGTGGEELDKGLTTVKAFCSIVDDLSLIADEHEELAKVFTKVSDSTTQYLPTFHKNHEIALEWIRKCEKDLEYNEDINTAERRQAVEKNRGNKKLPESLEALRVMDEKRIAYIKRLLSGALQEEARLYASIVLHLRNMDNHTSKISGEADQEYAATRFGASNHSDQTAEQTGPKIATTDESAGPDPTPVSVDSSNPSMVGKMMQMAKNLMPRFGGRRKKTPVPPKTAVDDTASRRAPQESIGAALIVGGAMEPLIPDPETGVAGREEPGSPPPLPKFGPPPVPRSPGSPSAPPLEDKAPDVPETQADANANTVPASDVSENHYQTIDDSVVVGDSGSKYVKIDENIYDLA